MDNGVFINEFDLWNIKKQRIDGKISSIGFHYYEREIWWCAMGKNIGSEENGKNENFERPVIIFRIFGPDTLWAIPLTTRIMAKKSRKEYEIICNGITRTADLAQLRLISTKRLLRYADTVSYTDFQIIRKYLKELI